MVTGLEVTGVVIGSLHESKRCFRLSAEGLECEIYCLAESENAGASCVGIYSWSRIKTGGMPERAFGVTSGGPVSWRACDTRTFPDGLQPVKMLAPWFNDLLL